MYHEVASSVIGPDGHTGWYVVADIPAPRGRRIRHRVDHRAIEEARARTETEWATLEPLLDPGTAAPCDVLDPSQWPEAEWWAGFLSDVLGTVEGRRGRRSTERRVLCVLVDSTAWATMASRKALPGAPVADRWSGVTKKTFIEEAADRAATQVGRQALWAESAASVEDLLVIEEEAATTAARARARIEMMQVQDVG